MLQETSYLVWMVRRGTAKSRPVPVVLAEMTGEEEEAMFTDDES